MNFVLERRVNQTKSCVLMLLLLIDNISGKSSLATFTNVEASVNSVRMTLINYELSKYFLWA